MANCTWDKILQDRALSMSFSLHLYEVRKPLYERFAQKHDFFLEHLYTLYTERANQRKLTKPCGNILDMFLGLWL
jgi:hypothetical protein